MPVYEQAYPSWTPSLRRRLRWWPVVRRELQVLVAQRGFQLILVVAALPVLIHLLQIYSANKLAADPHGELARALRNVEMIGIDAAFFFRFLKLQTYFVFILVLYAASGLVCDDLRLNLAEVYFSKPLTLRDYVLGKVAVVVGLGLTYTVVPVLFLFGAHLLMAPDATFLRENAWVPLACLGFSAVLVVPTSLAALACSAFTQSRRYAAAAIITLLVVDTFLAAMLADILNLRAIYIISVPSAMFRLGDALFGEVSYIPLAWPWALLVVGGVAAAGLAVLLQRVRRAEVGE